MARDKFIEFAPKVIAEGFAEVDAAAVEGESFEARHNRLFAQMINKVGKQLFNDTMYSNPLGGIYADSLDTGNIIEFVHAEVDGWIDDVTGGAYPNRDKMKEYATKTLAYYSDLAGVARAPFTIYTRELKKVCTSIANTDKFFTNKVVASRNTMELQRYLMAKQLIHRMLTDDDQTNTDRHKVITGITAINSKGDALAVWAVINKVVSAMQVSTKKYNKAGVLGQVPVTAMDGDAGIEIIAESGALSDLMTYAADIFNPANLNTYGIKFTKVDDFGGITSSVAATYSTEDGAQEADMSAATFTNPHEKTKFLIIERGALIATTNWEDMETQPVPGSRSITYDPQSEHNFGANPFKAFCEIKFA